jgi:tripartite ATP-independent transporter DctP family solute receptor
MFRSRSVMRLGGWMCSVLVGSLLALGAAGGAWAQDKMVIKASDVHPLGYPTVEAVQEMGRKLDQATGGRLTIEMYASMVLGGEKQVIEQAQVGAIQLARVSVGTLGPVVDDLNVFSLPFLFRNTAHMEKVIDGKVGDALLEKITQSGAGLVGLSWMDAGARNMYNTKKPIRTLEDLKGMKMRVIGNPIFVDMMNALGGNGVAMGYDQVFSALQTGVVDGAENNPPSYVFDNHYQVAKNFTLTEHLIVPEVLVFSRKAWDKLSAADQALIRKFARESQATERKLWVAKEKEAYDKMQQAGIVPVQISDKRPFQAAVKPVWDKYGSKYAELIKEIQAVK